MVRIIHCAAGDGSCTNETITILDGLEDPTPAEDYCTSSQVVVSDTEYDIELPSGFPVGHTFQRGF